MNSLTLVLMKNKESLVYIWHCMFVLIDRQISKTFLIYFLSGLATFLTLFFVIDFVTSLMRFDVNLSTLGRYYGAYSFQICYQFIPVAAMVGAVFTLSELNRNKELTALFSLGMSLGRILFPILFWAFILFGLLFFLGDQIIPVTKQKRDSIYYKEMKKKPALFSTLKTDKIWYRSGSVLFNVKLIDSENHKAFGVAFHHFSPDWHLERLIFSKEAVIQKRNWKLLDGKEITFFKDMTTPVIEKFKTKTISVDKELSDIQSTSSTSEFLSLRELRRYIKKNKEAGLNMTSFEVDYHNKFSFPFTVFVMVLMAVPFVTGHQRSAGFTKNVFLIISMTFIFWILHSFFISFGRHGQIPPVVATWGPNVLILLLTHYNFYWQKG